MSAATIAPPAPSTMSTTYNADCLYTVHMAQFQVPQLTTRKTICERTTQSNAFDITNV